MCVYSFQLQSSWDSNFEEMYFTCSEQYLLLLKSVTTQISVKI